MGACSELMMIDESGEQIDANGKCKKTYETDVQCLDDPYCVSTCEKQYKQQHPNVKGFCASDGICLCQWPC